MLSSAIERKRQRVGASLDFVGCFDNIFARLGLDVLKAWGLPEGVCTAMKGFYEEIRRFSRIGRVTITEAIPNLISVLQGCSMSVLILNGLMAVWAVYVKSTLDEEEDDDMLLSVFLDDRNMSTTTIDLLRRVLQHTDRFDAKINARLNQSKCQVHATVQQEELGDVLPEAERPSTLGFALPTGGRNPAPGEQASRKRQARCAKAIATAKKAASLPSETRVSAMNATFAQQYGYGCALQPLEPTQQAALLGALEAALLPGRTGRSAAVAWAVTFKGHALRPEKLTLMSCCKLLHVLLHKCEARWRATLEMLWARGRARKKGAGATPFQTLAILCNKEGWTWTSATTIRTPDTVMGPGTVLDFEDPNWGKLAHDIRTHLWHSMMDKGTFGERWDMKGAEDGVDIEKTRHLLIGKGRYELQPYERGALRSVLTGAVLTPSRKLAAGQLTEKQAQCVHCDEGARHTLGHALVLLEVDGRGELGGFDGRLRPRCLMRCGLVPRLTTNEYPTAMVVKLQKMMARIVAKMSPEPVQPHGAPVDVHPREWFAQEAMTLCSRGFAGHDR